MSQYVTMFGPKIKVSHFDIYFMVQCFQLYIFKTLGSLNIRLCDYESIRPNVLPHNNLIINLEHCDLYFMVWLFRLILYLQDHLM